MTETKRSISLLGTDSLDHDEKKPNILRSGNLVNDEKKLNPTKAGRKPIDTEPKSRRTAQNRAAQRAYRERKERKMKDLEEKVASLEDDKLKALSEQEILKAQINLLKRELSRATGQSANPLVESFDKSFVAAGQTASLLADMPLPDGASLWSWNSAFSNTKFLPQIESVQQLPDLVSGSSSSTSPLNDTTNATPTSSNLDSSSTISSANLNLVPTFDEQVNPFCAKLSEACGGANKPVPKVRRWGNPVPPMLDSKTDAFFALPGQDSPFHSLFSPKEGLTDSFFNSEISTNTLNLTQVEDTSPYDPLEFLNDAGFDVSLAFGNPTNDELSKPDLDNTDQNLASLVTEESIYDPLAKANAQFDFNECIKEATSSIQTSRTNSEAEGHHTVSSMSSFNNSPTILEEKEEVIPAGQKTMRCSEIWDRITSHPKYTEIDIDGLCKELQTKAKCSEKGVVINVNDVHNMIERSAWKKQ